MTTHVAMLRHYLTDQIQPASENGVVLVGTPEELYQALRSCDLVSIEPASEHVVDRPTISLADWMTT